MGIQLTRSGVVLQWKLHKYNSDSALVLVSNPHTVAHLQTLYQLCIYSPYIRW